MLGATAGPVEVAGARARVRGGAVERPYPAGRGGCGQLFGLCKRLYFCNVMVLSEAGQELCD